MNKKILLTMLFALLCVLSISAIQASDVNITDSNMASSSDDLIQLESESQTSDMESVNSNTLSTDNEEFVLEEDSKNQTELTAPTNTIYYKGSYNVTLKDSNSSNTLANKSVNFVIDNVSYVANTDDNGVASLNLTLTPGKYSVTAYFAGDDTYDATSNLTSTLEILSTVKAADITKYYKGSTQYSATFYDSYGNVLANRDVTITVNGKSYTKRTNANGGASVPVNLKPGTYKVTSTDPITGYQVTTTFKILPTVSATTLKKVAGDNKKFTAKFYKSNGKALAKKTIKFKLKGKIYKVKTNANGKASLSVKNLKKGTYTIYCYNTDGSYKTFKIKVYKKVSTSLITQHYTFLKKDKKTIKVTLKNSLGYAPTSGKIIKIKINGKTYTKKTNSKGVAYLKLPSLKKGVYKVKYTFSGTSNYKASKANYLVTVLTTKNSVLNVKSTTTFGYGAGTSFKVAATAGGVALAKRTITFEVDGKNYTRTTNNDGIASLPINLELGNYTVKYSLNQESNVNAKSAITPITVKLRSESKLTWKSGSSFSGSPQTFKILLTDLDDKAISGQTIKVIINSKTYTGTTASNGYATIKAYAPVGKYTVTVKFDGSNEYLSNSTTESVSITASTDIKGVTEKNTIDNLAPYLKATTNCQVGNSKIKSKVESLTSGLTSDYAKAEAIYNYVRDSISYSFYYDTKFGAAGTLSAGRGNCVDQAHLLVAMYRTAGLAARYVHGTCRFSSGSTYGHVWAQVLIGDTWVCADPTSSRNSFGKIVNWNTKSFSLHSRYASLPF
ncbi:Ig-like domain repeat protein [uncultured Methanobrevibacter sp.]|uniref:Ig-like domain repeat protein n=3 Tax=Methanobrevibacter TaxID=2172 RepID=UPI0025E43AAA|nr:Ig-like domain repeat protein [uncultured Methanobrevibacter sp.]